MPKIKNVPEYWHVFSSTDKWAISYYFFDVFSRQDARIELNPFAVCQASWDTSLEYPHGVVCNNLKINLLHKHTMHFIAILIIKIKSWDLVHLDQTIGKQPRQQLPRLDNCRIKQDNIMGIIFLVHKHFGPYKLWVRKFFWSNTILDPTNIHFPFTPTPSVCFWNLPLTLGRMNCMFNCHTQQSLTGLMWKG